MLPYWFLRLACILKPITTNTPFVPTVSECIILYPLLYTPKHGLVGKVGLEPTSLATLVPKTSEFTNFSTCPDTIFGDLVNDIFYFFNFLLELCPIIEETEATAGVEPPFVLVFFFLALYFSRLSIAVSNISSVL